MNRRGFLKAAGGLAVAAPVAAAAPRAGAILGGEWMGNALAAGASVAADIPAAGFSDLAFTPLRAAYAAFHRYNDSEWERARWLAIYRLHRIRVRRGRETRKPAKLLWLLDERRLASQRRVEAFDPTIDRKDRIRNARVRRLMKAAGFPGLPWDMENVAD